eukprot:TRINITY_DN4598_c0_g1_i1.p1 TRINITY_DN4598_c0_g1~~TRINITY_DN4598_c0_g1_i1.p1  ORF type:complete len:433 (+),score=38.91 TRINITY_DN4598_c0_g1_i1:432-1730(+)
MVSVSDFAENYSFQLQNEIQSMHWYSDQVTIFVHITYRHAEQAVDGRESTPENRDVVKEIHFYISDDKSHDTRFVQHCFKLHFDWMRGRGVTIERHANWSDGCAAQFKSAHAWYFVARFHALCGARMAWDFFASGHGKREHDGMGALVKSFLRREQLLEDGPRLTNAHEVTTLCREKLGTAAPSTFASRRAARDGVQRKFWEITEEELEGVVKKCCKTVDGTRKIHSIRGKAGSSTILFHRQLSCFCDACVREDWKECENVDRVGEWVQENLQPTDVPDEAEFVDEDDEPRFQGHHDMLSDALSPGDNFAIVCEDEEAEYYVCHCTKAKHRLSESIEDDGWGNSFEAGSMVLLAYYYERVGRLTGSHKYKLLDESPKAVVLSHLVKAIKFDMVPESAIERRQRKRRAGSKPVYNLSLEDHDNIMGSLEETSY